MQDNISKFYDAFNKKYKNFGTEQDFRDFLKTAKRENIDNLYKAFSAKYKNFNTADDMISYLGWSDSDSSPATAAPAATDASAPAGTSTSRRRMETPAPLAERGDGGVSIKGMMYNPDQQEETSVQEPERARPESADEKHERLAGMVAERKANYDAAHPEEGRLERMLDERRQNVVAQNAEKRQEAAESRREFEDMLEERSRMSNGYPVSRLWDAPDEVRSRVNPVAESPEELDAIKKDMEWERGFVKEYEERLKKVEDIEQGYRLSRAPSGTQMPDLSEDKEWLDRNKPQYDVLKRKIERVNAQATKFVPESLDRVEEKKREVVARGRTAGENAVKAGPGGFAAYPDGQTASEAAYDFAASQIYSQTEQVLKQGSKYDPGYQGDSLEQVYTAARQAIEGGANNVDLGTLTLGLTEGSSAWTARKALGEYNDIITSTVKDLGYSNGEVENLMSDLEKKGTKLESLVKELDASAAELKTMKDTLDDMVRNGESQESIRSYAAKLDKKAKEYGKRVKDEYEPLYNSYKSDEAKYNEVSSAVSAALDGKLTDGQKAVLDAVEEFTRAKALRSDDVSLASRSGAGLEETLEYMLDFFITGGIGKGGTKAATKLTLRHLEKKLGKQAVKDMALRQTINPSLWSRIVTDVGVAGLRTAAMVPRNVATSGELAMEYDGKDELGRYQFTKSEQDAVVGGMIQNFLGYWSEGFGEYMIPGERWLFSKVTGAAPKTAIGQTLRGYRGSIGRYLDHGKYSGQFNETIEELINSGMDAIVGLATDDRYGNKDAMKEFFDKENFATLTLSFLPLSAIGAATNMHAYHKMKQRHDAGVEGLKPFVESGAISQQDLDDLSAELHKMTPEEIKDAYVIMADQVREKNGGHLPKEFPDWWFGYVEGEYAMSLRNEQWENSQEKIDLVSAYAENYANPNPMEAWDANSREQETKKVAIVAGFTPDELDKDAYMLGQEAVEMRNEGQEERADILEAYATAKAANEGLRRGYDDETKGVMQARDANVRQNLDVNGTVTAATLTQDGETKRVFIVSDDATVTPDATVYTPTGKDGQVMYRESEEGGKEEIKTAKASEFSEVTRQTTESYVAGVNDVYERQRAAAYEHGLNTVSPMGQATAIAGNVGNTLVVRRNGVYAPVKIERMTDRGRRVVISGDKKAMQGLATAMGMTVPPDKYLETDVLALYPLLGKEEDNVTLTLAPESEQEQKEAAAAEAQAAEQNPAPEIKNGEYTISLHGQPSDVRVFQVNEDGVMFVDEEGNDGSMTIPEFRQAMQEASAPAQAAPVAEAAPAAQENAQNTAFPVDEKTGDKIYDHPSVTPQAAYDELFRNAKPGSKDEANRLKAVDRSAEAAAQELKDAETAIATAQREKAMADEWELRDDETLDALERRKEDARRDADRRIAEAQERIPELQRRVDHWNAVRQMAAQRIVGARVEQFKKQVKDRARKWQKLTGVKVKFVTSPDQIKNKGVKEQIEKGERVSGWFENGTGEVYIYIPNVANMDEVDRTYIHEVVSHKGLRGLLGDAGYDELCDRVWNELMTEGDRQYWKDEYNAFLKDKGHSEEYLRRAAADEYIAYISEHLNEGENKTLFDKIVEWVKDIIDRFLSSSDIESEAREKVAGTETMTKDVLRDLLADSMARYVVQARTGKKVAPLSTESLDKDIQKEMKDKGLEMDGGAVMDEQQYRLKKATGYQTPNELDEMANPVVGDVRFSKTTLPAWALNYMTYPDAKEHVVKVIENFNERCAADEIVRGVLPGGVYKYGEKSSGTKAGPLRTNIEYIVTFDMDTSCPRSLQYLEYVKQIERQIGRPLTQVESIQLMEMMRMYGQLIPCCYCYCENKRQALKQYYTNFMESRHKVINAKTEEEALEAMYGHETTKAARESKDPKVVLTDAAYKVFQKWRQVKDYNPTLKQLWAQYRNDRNVVLTVMDDMLAAGRFSTLTTDETIAKHVCNELNITDKDAQKAVEDIASEWKWNRIEDRPHDDFKRIEDEDDMVVDQRTLTLWREMTSYGKSASQAKNVLRYVPYTDELKTLSERDKKYINGMGGLRMHSSNDFRIDYVLDYFQFMADMAVNHMFGHTYTKSPEFVRIFGNSGYKINMSIAAYEDGHGIRPNAEEGFDWNVARELREKFPNAGVMLMATSDAQIQMALDSDWIDMFIPFHHSGLPKAVWYQMRHWTDYTSTQNERFLNGDEMREALEADGVEIPKNASAEEIEKLYIDHFNIRVETYKTGKKAGKRMAPHFLPGETIVDGVKIPGHNNDLQTYLDLCRQWGVHPRFYGVKVKDNTPEGGGREVDITEHPQYMKCIKETARTDTPQTAIEFNFDQPSAALDGMSPMEYAFRELEARAHAETEMAGSPVRSIYESYKQDPYGIVPQFIDTVIKHKETTGQDYPLDYLTPDSRRWFMTERKALEDAYKDFDTIPYHPHEYDADGNLIMTDENGTPDENVDIDEVAAEESEFRTRKVTDPAVLEALENGEWEEDAYRAVQFIPDPNGEWEYDLGDGKGMQRGNVYPPMSAQTEKGEWRNPIQKGVIEEAEEAPDKAVWKKGKKGGGWVFRLLKGNGKYVDAAYNPYIHSSNTMLNDQFSEAQSRGNLVVMRVAVPKSELDGENPYHAEKAKNHVGRHEWKAGPIQGELTGTRTVYLSRYDRPMELMPIGTVGENVANMLKGQVEIMPTNVVWPQLRAELENRGFQFVETNNKGKIVDGENAGKTWKQVYGKKNKKSGNPKKKTGTDTRFRRSNELQLGFVSNAAAALDRIKMDKATPEQWQKMLEKEGGLKAGEDKWLGLSDWLKSQDKKSITKDEIDDYIAEHRIMLAEADYMDAANLPYGGSKRWNDYVANELGEDVLEAFNFYEGDGGTAFDFRDEDIAAKVYKRLQKDFGLEHEIETEPGGEYTREDMNAMRKLADEIATYADAMVIDANPINSTRIGYTTDGLDNKREIALVVPTVESWNESDNIHFGDAGNGRAVAWVRFGDTTTYDPSVRELNDRYGEARATLDEYRDQLIRKYSLKATGSKRYTDLATPEEMEKLASLKDEEKRIYDARETLLSNRPRVLVIDEIQSKRHQEGRDRGYKNTPEEKRAREKYEAAKKVYDDYLESVFGTRYVNGRVDSEYLEEHPLTEEQRARINELNNDVRVAMHELDELTNSNFAAIPAAPFEKNWHELAMKRMLRLAAEEGYDYVAWTTGDQQAERYNIGKKIDSIERMREFDTGEVRYDLFPSNGGGSISLFVKDGIVTRSRYDELAGKRLDEVVGKEIADKMLGMADGESLSGENLSVGGEGMKGFYDDILPRFMNKYGKKWGVKVSDIELPLVESAGNVMHAVPVTKEMKESMMEGQTMFRKSGPEREAAREREVTHEKELNARFNRQLDFTREAVDYYRKNGKMPDDYRPATYRLGNPFGTLLAAGMEDVPIRMKEDNLLDASAQGPGLRHGYHKYDIGDVRNLVSLLNHPIAVLRCGRNGFGMVMDKKDKNGNNYFAYVRGKKEPGGKTTSYEVITIYPINKEGFRREIFENLLGEKNDLAWATTDVKRITSLTNGKVYNLRSYYTTVRDVVANINKKFGNKQDFLRFDAENRENVGETRFRVSVDPESQKLFDAAKERFGTTTDVREAGYILPDGTMLDFSGRHWTDDARDNSWLNGMRQVDHREIQDINYEKDGNTPTGLDTNMSDFIRRGAIRISYPGSINLSVKPTWDQEEALEKLIRMDNKFVRVDFGDGNHTDHYADYDYARPANVIDDIYEYFENGVKPGGDVRFRRSYEDVQKEVRIAAAEREATGETLADMGQVLEVGVNQVTRKDMPAGHKSDKGYYDHAANDLRLCMENVTDERDAIATVFHETVGWNGLTGLFGDQFQETMARAYAALDNRGKAFVNGFIVRNGLQPGDEAISRAMMEYLSGIEARNGGTMMDNVNEVLGKVVDDLFGTDGFFFTGNELAYILRASFEHMKNPGWLNTPSGKAKDTLWKRELGINESDPNRPTDPDGPGAVVRYRRGDTGNAAVDYNSEMRNTMNIIVMENQNADLPVKIGIEKVMKEIGRDRLTDAEDYITRHNLASSRAETEGHDFMLFHFTPLLEQMREVQSLLLGDRPSKSEREDAYERILDYMYAVSGLERNESKRAETGEERDFSGITSLMGYSMDEWEDKWQQAEEDAKKMIAVFRTDLRDALWTDGKTGAEAQAEADVMLEELWNRVRSCTDYSLDHALKYGLISQEAYDRLHGTDTQPRMWNYYLPLRGFEEKTAEDEFEFSYANVVGRDNGAKVVKEADGRWTEADNPIANILHIAEYEIVQGNENFARQALYRFAVNAGKNSLISVRKPWYELVDKKRNLWRLAQPGEKQDIEAFEKDMREKKEQGLARQGRKGAKATPDNDLKLGMILGSEALKNQQLIKLKVGGEDRMIWVNGDPAMARAVSGFGRKPNWEGFRRASRVISNMFTTYSLDFSVKNLIRDSIYSRVALLMKEDGKYRWTFLQNWWNNFGYGAFAFPMMRLAALWESGELQRKENPTEKEQLFIDFMHDGGQTGYTIIQSVNKIKREIEKTMRRAGKETGGPKIKVGGAEIPIFGIYGWGVRTLNEAFELLTRFTAYQTSRQLGRSGQRAAFDAKEVSVNFNRRGAQSGEGFWGNIAAYLGGTHYFYNAGVQGFDNFLRLFKVQPVGMSVASLGLMIMGGLTPFINSLFAGADGDGDDDNWYWNLPEWVRRNNIIIGWPGKTKDENGKKVKDGTATYFAIPLPVEFRAMYGLGDIMSSIWAYNKYPDPSFGNVALDMLSTAGGILPVNPVEDYAGSKNAGDMFWRTVAPDITMFLVDWGTNHDYTGRQLAKTNLFGKEIVPKSQGAYASTPKALVKACQEIGMVFGWDIPPGVARDALNSYLGGYYKTAEDIAKRLFTDDEHPKRWDDIPFLSGFTGHVDEDRNDTYVKNVLNAYRDVEQGVVRNLNLRLGIGDLDEEIVYETPDKVLDMAKGTLQRAIVQRILESEDWELGKTYYEGTKDEDTGKVVTERKRVQTGKNKGKPYKRKKELKEPGTESLKKAWNKERKIWLAMPDGTPEERSAKADQKRKVQEAWHLYYDAQANLADELMRQEYDK